MILYLIQGVGLGFAGAAQPGPFQTYIISQALKNGWQRTLPSALAPLISDGLIILIVLLVLSQVPDGLQRGLHIASGLFITYLSVSAFLRWRHFDKRALPARESSPQSLLKAIVMNLISPGPYVYWSLVAGPTLLSGWRAAPINGIAFLFGFYATLVTTFGAIILTFGSASRLGPRINRALIGLSAAALACFAVYQLWLGVAG
ncbi:MAG: LysE family transporter [Candidatus Eisenbacteria sp.]|nr:LysE family transporter [Candidatus Eisenbacteria bacterium]